MKQLVFFTCIACWFSFYAYTQPVSLTIHSVDSAFSKEFSNHKSLKEAYSFLRKKHRELLEQGYLAASFDSISSSDTSLNVWLYKGIVYKWANLSFRNLPPLLWNAIGLSGEVWENQHINPARFARLNEKILQYCENNGYPFASTYLDSISHAKNGISANLNLDFGPLTKIDTIIIERQQGNLDVSFAFLSSYIGIRQGDLYDERKLKLLSKKLNELPFLQQYQPWKLDFTINKNQLHLYLKEKKANRLNGLIGLQPNTLETGKLMLTADFLLGLQNSLGYGETINIIFQNLQYQSPRFNAGLIIPYILGTPFGLEGSFDLFKKDTTYRKTSFEGGLRFQINSGDYVKLVYQHFSNRLITADTSFVLFHKKLPENLDINTNGIGLVLELDKTDYKFNPSRGWTAGLSTSALLRKIIPNDAITLLDDGSGFDYMQLYDDANDEKYQYRILGKAGYYFKLYKNLIVAVNYHGGYISGKELFQNELFQLGGFQLLRGFDEQSIYARHYHIGSVELRLLLGQNSYFYIFNDNAFVSTSIAKVKSENFPVSFGTGISLDNSGGTFNIALGLGKNSGESFEFRRARVHFGYVAYF